MATWLAHLRVADMIQQAFPGLSRVDFIAGNIAPDCGLPVPGGFDPPKEVTHWTESGKGHCDYGRFYREMIARKPGDGNPAKHLDERTRSFLLGYCAHLAADVLWVRLINEPCKQRNIGLYTSDRSEYYRLVKPEWYANDHIYLRDNPDDPGFRTLCGITDYPVDCIPYYGVDYVERQIYHIKRFYLEPPDYSTEFRFLTPQMMQDWVDTAAQEVVVILNGLTK